MRPLADAPVLVVDPSADIREMYGQALAFSGLPVIYAEDGREALVQICRATPRAVVADGRLGFIDTLQLLTLVRSDSATASTRFVVVTGDPARVSAMLERGADDVLVKPVSLDALAEAVVREPAARPQLPRAEPPASPPDVAERARRRVTKVRAHDRYATCQPPNAPPRLNCPLCDALLMYDRSYVGGVSERHPEQWDSFRCPTHGEFQYRHRTRRLRHAC